MPGLGGLHPETTYTRSRDEPRDFLPRAGFGRMLRPEDELLAPSWTSDVSLFEVPIPNLMLSLQVSTVLTRTGSS